MTEEIANEIRHKVRSYYHLLDSMQLNAVECAIREGTPVHVLMPYDKRLAAEMVFK